IEKKRKSLTRPVKVFRNTGSRSWGWKWKTGRRSWVSWRLKRFRNLFLRFRPRAQDFRHAPGLGHTAAWGERLVGIEDFADRPNARIGKMRRKRFQKTPRAGIVVGIDPQP